MTDHFVLRVPLMTSIHGRSFNTIEAHNQVVEKSGRVALAKFGNPGTRTRFEKLKVQIEDGTETRLILVVRRDDRFLGYQSSLSSVHYGKPDRAILSISPPYYEKLDVPSGLWFIVASPFVATNLKDFHLSTNNRPLLEVMRECRTSAMLVQGA